MAVLSAYAAPLFFTRDEYWHYLFLPPLALHGVVVVPLVLAGTFVAVRGLIRGRRAQAPGDDLWYVAAALLGVPYVLMLVAYAVIAAFFVIYFMTCRCSLF